MKYTAVVVMAVLLGGCVGSGNWGEGVGWPRGGTVVKAAKKAAFDPQTWVPLATAGLLIATDVDNKWSRDLADDEHLFGDDAEDTSNGMLDVLGGAYVLSALLAPSPTIKDKVKGLAVGGGTLLVGGMMSNGLKDLTKRERPERTNDRSMPSGHAFRGSSLATMSIRNMRDIDMPGWSRQAASWAVHGLAVGTGMARVEADKHHLSDIFVGYALGNFLARFMYEVFLENNGSEAMLTFHPVESGGALTLQVPLK